MDRVKKDFTFESYIKNGKPVLKPIVKFCQDPDVVIKAFEKELLQLLEIARGEVEKLDRYDPESYNDNEMDCILSMEKSSHGDYLSRQDVLDLLTFKDK